MAVLPFDESAPIRLIEGLLLGGRTADAITRHAQVVARLRGQGVEPSVELMALGGRLERGSSPRKDIQTLGSAALFSPDFVGRGHAFAELGRAWSAAVAGGFMAVLVEAELGLGKTRLCDSSCSAARRPALRHECLRCEVLASLPRLRWRAWGAWSPGWLLRPGWWPHQPGRWPSGRRRSHPPRPLLLPSRGLRQTTAGRRAGEARAAAAKNVGHWRDDTAARRREPARPRACAVRGAGAGAAPRDRAHR